MSMSKEQIAANMEKLKQEQKQREDIIAKKQGREPVDADKDNAAKEIEWLKEQLASAKKEIDEARNERDIAADKADKVEENKKLARDSSAMNEIIAGSAVKKFKKDYTFKAGDQDIKIHVEMHGPNISELAKIEATAIELNDYSDYSDEMDNGIKQVYRAVANFVVLGDNVPDWFKSTDSHRIDILLYVYQDFSEWYDTFLKTQVQ